MRLGALALSLVLLLPHAFAQGVQVYDNRDPSQQPKQYQPSDDEAAVDQLQKELAAQNKAMAQAGEMLESPDEKKARADAETAKNAPRESESEGGMPGLNPDLMEIQKALQSGKSSLDVIQDPTLRKKLISAYQTNPMALMPREFLKEAIATQMKQTPAAGLFQRFPKLLDFFVDFMRHPKAIGQAVKILDRQDDLKTCGYVSLGLMVLVFFLRRKLINEDTPFFRKIFIRLGCSALFLGGSIGYLWHNFSAELGPGVEVFKQTFL